MKRGYLRRLYRWASRTQAEKDLADFTYLRWVRLTGPALPSGKPMWLLRTGAPRGGPHSEATYNHPIRTLAIDSRPTTIVQEDGEKRYLRSLRAPRLLDLHIIAGSKSPGTEPNGEDEEMLALGFASTVNASISKPIFRTIVEGEPSKAAFNRVIAEPWPGSKFKGDFVDQDKADLHIRMPRLRLVQGSIRLNGTFKWLGSLALAPAVEIVLTPEGIVLETAMELPGISKKIEGGFLLAPSSLPALDSKVYAHSGLALTLLPHHPKTVANQADWKAAWNKLVGFSSTATEVGLKLRSRQGGAPIAFQWPLYLEGTSIVPPGSAKQLPPLAVDVPPRDLRVELLGSIEPDGTPDGIAVLRTQRVRLSTKQAAKLIHDKVGPPGADLPDANVQLVVEAGESKKPNSDLWVVGKIDTSEKLTFEVKNASIGHDEHDLARHLRHAAGWETPLRKPKEQTAPASFTVEHQPIVSGFARVERGWLQLPFPNLPPIDPKKDNELLQGRRDEARSAFDGYIRLSSRGSQAFVSGHNDEPAPVISHKAPWSMTIEDAPSITIFAGLNIDEQKIDAANIYLKNPNLSFSGLLWLSLDRPDAIEALPRLSAGAGSFLDVKFASLSPAQLSSRVISAKLDTWSATFEKNNAQLTSTLSLEFLPKAKPWAEGPARTEAGKAALSAARMVLGAKPEDESEPWPSVYWQRHEKIPLATAMPMTRVASSAIQPLESRELGPFVVNCTAEDGSIPIAKLSLGTNRTFPHLELETKGLAAKWPQPSNFDAAMPFVAFGCPGVELLPAVASDAWSKLKFAARYDIPCLDEAFSTASLPPAADTSAQDAQPVATALDWPLLAQFWHDQARRRQISMVIDSYIMQGADVGEKPAEPTITSLVRGAEWTPKIGFKPDSGYGDLILTHDGSTSTLSGNEALKGLTSSANQKVRVMFKGKQRELSMLGWSPATFTIEPFSYDNQGVGLRVPDPANPLVRSTELTHPEPRYVVSSPASISTTHAGWQFWYKDVPLELKSSEGPKRYEYAGSSSVRFNAWEDPTGGHEWRLFDPNDEFQERLILAGLGFEPLKLSRMVFDHANGQLASAPLSFAVIGRVWLTEEDDHLPDSGNLVELKFERDGDAYTLKSAEMNGGGDLDFSFSIRDKATQRERPVTLRLSVTADDGKAKFTGKLLRVNFHGYAVEFKNPTFVWKPADDELEIAWEAKTEEIDDDRSKGSFGPGAAQLVIEEVAVHIAKRTAKEFRYQSRIEVWPEGSTEAPVILEISGISGKLSFLGNSLDVKELHELSKAVVVTGSTEASGTALSLFDFNSGVFMLASRIESPSNTSPHILPLSCGVCDGAFYQSDTSQPVLQWQIMQWEGKQKEPAPWRGQMTVTTTLTKTSAITWPKVKSETFGKGYEHTVAIVKREGSDSYADTATYYLDHHRLDFSLCGKSDGEWRLIEPWSFFAVAQHSVSPFPQSSVTSEKPTATLRGVEMVAIGPASKLIPRTDQPPTHTFAARYKEPRGGVGADSSMLQAGIGELATVLRGSLGKVFRTEFWKQIKPDPIVLLGGFIGLPQEPGPQKLLRLPFLWLSTGKVRFDQSDIPANGITIAWPDASASPIYASGTPAPSPTNFGEDAVLKAIRLGAVPDDANRPPEHVNAAQMVEQFFGPSQVTKPWTANPYWLSAAASLSEFIKPVRQSEQAIPMLSIVAGSRLIKNSKITKSRGYAAVVGPVSIEAKAKYAPLRDAQLITAGKSLKILEWTGSEKIAADVAASVHATPVFALIRQSHSYTYVTLKPSLKTEMPSLRPRSAKPSQKQFEDPERGYAVHPGVGSKRWLWPALEGDIKAVRDDRPAQPDLPAQPSGIAGLARQYRLPRSSGNSGELTWFSQKSTPVYLPLQIEGLLSPPIPWLQQAPPKSRLPVPTDVTRALQGAGIADGIVQPIVPPACDSISLGSRSGVIMAQRASLLASAGGATAFDEGYSRFGRPAQAGSSSRRWMRTPRPGPIPENTRRLHLNRRVEASPLTPEQSVRFLVGAADIVVGGDDEPWTATFVAAPLSDGIVSDAWDGSVRLRVEILRAHYGEPASPVEFLASILFPLEAPNSKTARASATLTVGGKIYAFTSIKMLAAPDARAVDIVLDFGEGAASGKRHLEIADAIESGTSVVDLALTVHPGVPPSAAPDAETLTAIPVDKWCHLSDPGVLPYGEDRPPTTLRWRLPAVARSRGALPLLPTSLIFHDPAYDRELANAPHMSLPYDTGDKHEGRGNIFGIIYADRNRINRRGSIAIMADLRFERPPPETFQHDDPRDGDFVKSKLNPEQLALSVKLIPKRSGQMSRLLRVGSSASVSIGFSKIYELRLEALSEVDGAPAIIEAGDTLQIAVSGQSDKKVCLLTGQQNGETCITFDKTREMNPLAVTITDDPVAEPPSALYAALVRCGGSLGLPLYAQSPLPSRLDFGNLKRDFRAGLVRRTAFFVWTLPTPKSEKPSAFIVKVDRNGQMYLPKGSDEFSSLQSAVEQSQ